MKERIMKWEETVHRIVDRGTHYVMAFILLDICTMIMAVGICSIFGAIIGFIVGMAPYWSEMLLAWFVVYMGLFCWMMDFTKYDLDQEDETEELKAMILELQDDEDEDENG